MLFTLSVDTPVSFPLVIRPNEHVTQDNFLEAISTEKERLREGLAKAGAIHFKGFKQSLESFDPFMETLFWDREPFNPLLPGIFSGGRNLLAHNVVETTYLDKKLPMAMHNEFAYLPSYPSFICFRCLKAPASGGETAIADFRKVYDEIDPSLRKRFEAKNVKYNRNLYSKRWLSEMINRFIKIDESWMEVFGTNIREDVEQICDQHQLKYSWRKNGCLHIENTLPASRQHPSTGETVWFNIAAHMLKHSKHNGWMAQAISQLLYPTASSVPGYSTYGDGTNISSEDASHIRAVIDRNTINVKWSEGDTLICDNFLSAHTRLPYTGERSLAGAMRC